MSWWGSWTALKQLELLQQVNDEKLQRSRLFGDLEPYLLEGKSVSGQLTLLALRGLVVFDLAGAVRITGRGQQCLLRAALDGPALPWEPSLPSRVAPPQPT